MIRVYNTLSRTKEPLAPVQPGKVGIYLCGPTVYKPSHIGHLVGPVIFDAIKRYLTYCGYEVTWVVNITDVDDKLIHKSNELGMGMAELAARMTDDYMRCLEVMGIDTIDHFPRATDHIEDIIAFTSELIDGGFAYVSEGDVYFEVSKASDYGKLTRRSPDAVQGEGGGAAAKKRSGADFALWKSAKSDEPSWGSPWGPGRPGWHIECSAMSAKLLGETFDIHGGGLDLVFPHHENELAQSECRFGKPMAKYWMHNGLMQASSEVGKLGGRETIARPDVGDQASQEANKLAGRHGAQSFLLLLEEEQFQAEQIRFFLLSTHYRRPIDFSIERIREVGTGLETFYRLFKRFERVTGENFHQICPPARREDAQDVTSEDDPLGVDMAAHHSRFLEAMDDDFNTAAAIAELFEMGRRLNKYVEQEKLEAPGSPDPVKLAALRRGVGVLREVAATLGLFTSEPERSTGGDDAMVGKLVELLIELRADARKSKDFATADRIRDSLGQIGVVLEDRPGGTDWSTS